MTREEAAGRAAEAVARTGYGKLVAFLAARTRDVAAAEDALADAFAAALADWPRTGCPDRPEAWLLTVARRKLIDRQRRRRAADAAGDHLRLLADDRATAGAAAEAARAEAIPDQRLALMFTCAHPAIDPAIRAPLMLQVVLGLDAKAIASAFLTAPAAMGKRLVRAKEKIRQALIPFAVPEPDDLPERLGAVLDAIYAAFTAGWTDADGTDPARRDLTIEAVFLARVVVALLPGAAEAMGLLALMLHAEARRPARRDARGDYVRLADQDTALWDAAAIAEAEALLRRAGALGTIGRFQIEAAIQSAHAHRRLTGRANWAEIVTLYDALLALSGSPVVALNRALAIAELIGPAAALEAMAAIAGDPRLRDYQPWWAARADLLARTGAHGDAAHAYAIAVGLSGDPAVRRFLQRRRAALRV